MTASEPVTSPIVDSHCHLDLDQFDDDRPQVVTRARAAGVRAIVNPGIDLEHSRAAIALAERYAEVYAAVGMHPNSSAGFDGGTLEALRALAAHPRVVALGEIGLDYYWQRVEPAVQRAAFEAQLELAAELGLPVIIHCREANADVAAVLRAWVGGVAFRESRLARTREFAGVLHAFPGDQALAEEAYGWGFVLGLGGPVTFRNARTLHALVPYLRLDRLMLETDAPYLTPHPHRGQRNEPAYTALVARQLAELYGTTVDAVAQATTTVAARFFGWTLFAEDGIGRADSPEEQSAPRARAGDGGAGYVARSTAAA
jgi:TatD DNase family protein